MSNTDKYIGFEYNGIKVNMGPNADIKGFIINGGEDLNFPSFPDFSNEFAFPKFGEVSYFLGTTIENRTIGFSISLYEVTLQEYREMLAVFSSKKTTYNNLLKFDYNDYFGYNVKLNSASSGKFVVSRTCDINNVPTDLYNIELDLEFVTYNDWAAKCIESPSFNLNEATSGVSYANGKFSFESTIVNDSDPEEDYDIKLAIKNNGTIPIFLKINFNTLISSSSNFKIYSNSKLWYHINRRSNYSIYTKYGIVLNSVGAFYNTIQNNGVLEIPVGSTRINISSSETFDFEKITIEPILREMI